MKKCPFCAEDIRDEAILCRFCGRDVRAPVPPPPVQSVVSAHPRPRRKRRLGAVLAVLGLLGTFSGASGFGFTLLWVGLWLALPGSAFVRAAVGLVAAVLLQIPASAVRAHDISPGTKSPELSAPANTSAVIPVSRRAVRSDGFQVVSVDSRITESNDVFSKFAWNLILNNETAETLNCRATVEFLDSDGVLVDDHSEYNLVVPANQHESFTGSALLIASAAGTIHRTQAKATCR